MLSWIGLIREFFESHCKVPKAPSIQGLEQTQQLNEQSKYRFYMRNGCREKKCHVRLCDHSATPISFLFAI